MVGGEAAAADVDVGKTSDVPDGAAQAKTVQARMAQHFLIARRPPAAGWPGSSPHFDIPSFQSAR
jgi:hypothetical protein